MAEKNNDPIRIIESADGSHTLYHPALNETYHSTHGALQESTHVFIEAGLEPQLPRQDRLQILEVGFGTGLNAWLTLQKATSHQHPILFHTLEPYPIEETLYSKLNYTGEAEKSLFLQMHQCAWETEVALTPYFTIRKIQQTLEVYEAPESVYDLIYFDAFAPSKQAEVWVLSNIEKIYRMVRPGGVLVSYCARGQFKRDLKAAGFEVETLPGPPGKKEMTRGVKSVVEK
jgi:tRNA U34 5-methylaminomethyl-2-thiouridine-forming methyltransferase MnmC